MWAKLLSIGFAVVSTGVIHAAPLNVVLITVDDMSCDSVGAYGCAVPNTTPRMDAFARESLRFEHAHTQVGNCMPCRNVLMTGLYPHQNGIEGFRQLKPGKVSQLSDDFRAAGYLTAIRGKASHSNPYHPYDGWEIQLTDQTEKSRDQKRPASFGESTTLAFQHAREANKPLFLSINISDPHLPFYAYDSRRGVFEDENKPSRVFEPDEVVVPGFLFEHPTVRLELAHYYSSVRRADDALGSILDALDASGAADNTIVVFFSDHGMPLPFAKTQLYHHSTHTPLIVRWPGHTKPDRVDAVHMVSVVDIAPTLLDATGVATDREMAGRSFVPVLNGEQQAGREYVIKTYYENSGRNRQPMRSIQTRTLGYIFNPWSGNDAEGVPRNFATATDGTRTYKTMVELAKSDEAIAARLDLMDHRVLEELYDYEADPDALNNLIDSPTHQEALAKLRSDLLKEMQRIDDPLADVFAARDPNTIRDYMLDVDAEVAAIKAAQRAQKQKNEKSGQTVRKRKNLISLSNPKAFTAGEQITVEVAHKFSKRDGAQVLTVTLKGADNKRIERKTVNVSGEGTATVSFDVPASVEGLRIAAFVGEDFSETPQHVSSGLIGVE